MNSEILRAFPKTELAFAYGSGVKKQVGYGEEVAPDTMVDVVFVVDDTLRWHTENLQRNSQHYSALGKWGGSRIVSKVQEDFGAGIYYNTMVDLKLPQSGKNLYMKYGVISKEAILDDLRNWTTLYTSGRLHKPVSFLQQPMDPGLIFALSDNVQNAVKASLLLLPDKFGEDELYYTIAGLSYAGDVRMGVAENPNKVRNIVDGNQLEFKNLYRPYLEHVVKAGDLESSSTSVSSEQSYVQFQSQFDRVAMASSLPSGLANPSVTGVADPRLLSDPGVLRRALTSVVRKSSFSQTLKALPAAGVAKSVVYAARKVMKRLK